jgi:hypothetical protein
MDDIPDFATGLDDEEDEQDAGEKPYEGDDQLEEGDRLLETCRVPQALAMPETT